MKKILIGIDPDTEKSGFAKIEGSQLKLDNLTFFELLEELKFYKEREIKPIIYIECGFLNKSNWHVKEGFNSKTTAQIGQRTGANHEVAKKIIEMCIYLQLPYVQVKPTASKITNDFFKSLTGYKGKTNQEQRDSFMLIHGR
ncbi:MAG: hypothetical protein H7Z76_11620 [Methylotenera sp.]|nr:hypothetical protein [Flavobacterium sp.]